MSMDIISNNVGTWLAAVIVALLTIFSDKILGRIRFSLNRADLRVKYFEQLATDLSTYVFWVEVYHERFQRHWTDDLEDLEQIAGELNTAMTNLRKNEYVYLSWVHKYWGKNAAARFSDVMVSVKSVDIHTHAFNDPGKRKEKVAALGNQLEAMRQKVTQWLSKTGA